jgi:hypothetical protein
MSVTGRSEVSIDLFSCEFALPRNHATGPLRHRLAQVLETRLAGAIDDGLAALGAPAPDAVWVIRSLDSIATVSESVEDLDALAADWGGQLAADIVRAVTAGGQDVVHYSSRAAQLADFAAALAGGRADGWMYAPLSGLKLLRPTVAIATGAQGAGIPVTEVVDALIDGGRLEHVLAAASPAEAVRLWALCVAHAMRVTAPSRQLVGVLRGLAARKLPADLSTALRGAAALRLIALARATHPAGPELYGAAAIALGDVSARPVSDRPERLDPERDGQAGRAPGARGRARPAGAAGGQAAPLAARSFAALGAPAFMLLRSLERLGLETAPAQARARVLGLVLRCSPDDEALHLASGETLDASPLHLDGPALLAAVRAQLREDGRLDGRWLHAGVAAHPDGRRTVALVSDLVTDTWLAGGIYDDPQQIPWPGLREEASEALREPGRLVDRPNPECARHFEARRLPERELRWLAPADPDALATGLVARAAARDLADRLPGFASSTLSYLAARFLPPGGTIAVCAQQIDVELPPAELGVILTMAGLERFSYRVPWLAQEISVVHRGG